MEENNEDIAFGMEVSSFSLCDDGVIISYNENGLIKTLKGHMLHADFISAISSIDPVCRFHLDLMALSQERLRVIGVEKVFPYGYKLICFLNCNDKDYRIKSKKYIPKSDDYFDNEKNMRLRAECLEFFDEQDTGLVEAAFKEAALYVQGKRKPDLQLKLDI